MRKEISSFHYLTQDLSHRSHEEQVRIACEAGVKWIQLRVKDKSLKEWIRIAQAAKKICNRFQTTLIINDNAEVAKAIDADGVHLGQQDQPLVEARKILGNEKIIGCSAHSLDELLAVKDFDVDYFGLGPFRFTSTKKNLDAVLGLGEMKRIIRQARTAGISKSIIAIGGIELDDVNEILEAGADGVAVSSAINLSVNPNQPITNFLWAIENRIHKAAQVHSPITIQQ